MRVFFGVPKATMMDLEWLLRAAHLYEWLSAAEYARATSTCRALRASRDDTIWRHFAIRMFGVEFWVRASAQPHRPWHECLVRIVEFERALQRHAFPRWTADDYYRYWEAKHADLYPRA